MSSDALDHATDVLYAHLDANDALPSRDACRQAASAAISAYLSSGPPRAIAVRTGDVSEFDVDKVLAVLRRGALP